MVSIMLMFLTIIAQGQKNTILFQDDFEGPSLSWTITGGEWEWGAPQGLHSSSYGNADPSSAHGGTKVIGTDLSDDGDYSPNSNCSITSPAINCSGYIGVTLSFYRWLNVETADYDHARVEVSNDGSNWTVVWENPDGWGNHTTDDSWVYQEFDISSIADNQSTVYVRFTLSSDGSWQFSGWNIDDVVVTGNNEPDISVDSYSPKGGYEPGDSNVPFTVVLKNNGIDATGIQATLVSDDAYVTVSSTNNPFNAGNLAYGDTTSNGSNPYYLSISSSCPDGHEANLIVDITADGGYSTQDTISIKIGRAEWTFMVYINGDNNLSSYGDDDRSEMESVGSNSNLNIVVQQDWSGSGGTVRWFVNNGSSDTVMALPEQDMADPATLTNFANWAIDNYPAKHYALIVWDHGGGWEKNMRPPVWKAFSWDDQSGDSISLSLGEMDTALYHIKEHLGHNIDIFGFDACLMGMLEVADIAKKYVDYVVFSEKTEPGDGWPYDDILDTLAHNPYLSPYEFSGEIAKRYVESYSGGSQGNSDVTQSAIALGEDWHKLLTHLDHLSRELIIAGGKGISSLNTARNNTVEMDVAENVDLYDAVENIKAQNLSSTINALCDSVEFYIDRVVVYHGFNDAGSSNGWANTHGLAIYYPGRNTNPAAAYGNFDFSKNNTWYDYISGASSSSGISSVKMHLSSYTYDDQYNHNGVIGQSESVLLYPEIENSGSSTAQNVVLHLRTDDPNVAIDDSVINVGDVNAFSKVTPGTAVRFTVSGDIPLNSNIVLKVVITSTSKATENIEYLTFHVGEPLSVEESRNVTHKVQAGFISYGQFVYRVTSSRYPVDVSLYSVDGRFIKKVYTGIPQNPVDRVISQVKQGIYFIVEKRISGIRKTRLIVVR